MMPGHASRCRIIRIIITDHQTIYRNIHFSALYKFRPSVNGFRKFLGGCRFPVYHIKSQFFQKVHPLSPRYHRLIQMHQCKCMKPDMAGSSLLPDLPDSAFRMPDFADLHIFHRHPQSCR